LETKVDKELAAQKKPPPKKQTVTTKNNSKTDKAIPQTSENMEVPPPGKGLKNVQVVEKRNL